MTVADALLLTASAPASETEPPDITTALTDYGYGRRGWVRVCVGGCFWGVWGERDCVVRMSCVGELVGACCGFVVGSESSTAMLITINLDAARPRHISSLNIAMKVSCT